MIYKTQNDAIYQLHTLTTPVYFILADICKEGGSVVLELK